MTVHDPNVLAGVRTHHLFAGLAPPQLQRLLATAHVEDADAGQVLFDRGQPARHFYIVIDGQGSVTWREEHLGRQRNLGITLEPFDPVEALRYE